MKKLLWLASALLSIHLTAAAASANIAANAINQLGIDLLRQTKPDQNTVLSPYSIQSAMAMAYEGADGATRTEMAKVLHYPDNDQIRDSLNILRKSLEQIANNSKASVEELQKEVNKSFDPFTLSTANRLFGQVGYEFRAPYLSLLKANYDAPFEALDFRSNAAPSAKHINDWVEQQTHNRIKDLISTTALNALTRLVLVNAIYLKAPWMEPFKATATKPNTFFLLNAKPVKIPTMVQETARFGYDNFKDFVAVTLPYQPSDLQLLIILPKSRTGLGALQTKLSPELLARCSQLQERQIILHLPKFKIQPPLFALKDGFEQLGMKQAFNVPVGSANFDKIAPRHGDDYLYISDIFHKTFIDVDEKGTEAAAATSIVIMTMGIHREPPKPIEVRIDHPFLFAIQHRDTGACLFLGRVTDPTKN
ncbi:MAG: Proteinase inhibitor serpin [Verrucomicrobiales bacterium]|nr:Proteinase inhibitor serpin [Verrucomicrobiales bacterium]